MIIALALLVAALSPAVLADVKFRQPAAGSSYAAGAVIPISWSESNTAPLISTLTNYVIQLCAGGNSATSYTCLATLTTGGAFSTGSTAQNVLPITATLGADSTNGYFLMIVSTGPSGTVTNFSPRFGLTGMTGSFPQNVIAGISSVGASKNGPPTLNGQTNNAPPVNPGNPDAPVDATINPSTVPSDTFSVAYNMQTGEIRYAPMQPQPLTKIAAASMSMPYPTSSVQKATAAMGAPNAQTTVTQIRPITVPGIENTASAAPFTAEAMQKWLNRWKD